MGRKCEVLEWRFQYRKLPNILDVCPRNLILVIYWLEILAVRVKRATTILVLGTLSGRMSARKLFVEFFSLAFQHLPSSFLPKYLPNFIYYYIDTWANLDLI
jgi:hypothetical protein